MADLLDLRPRLDRAVLDSGTDVEVYQCLLLADDVTVGQLAHALRFSGLVLSTDKVSSLPVIHHAPRGAA